MCFRFGKTQKLKKSASVNEMRQQLSDAAVAKAAGAVSTLKSNHSDDHKVL